LTVFTSLACSLAEPPATKGCQLGGDRCPRTTAATYLLASYYTQRQPDVRRLGSTTVGLHIFLIVYINATESKPEFYMNSSTVFNNLQHGMFLENVRNYVIVNSSSVTHNGYGAGIRIYSGAGIFTPRPSYAGASCKQVMW